MSILTTSLKADKSLPLSHIQPVNPLQTPMNLLTVVGKTLSNTLQSNQNGQTQSPGNKK